METKTFRITITTDIKALSRDEAMEAMQDMVDRLYGDIYGYNIVQIVPEAKE